jgi:SAM-dependent methyltransferase
MEYTGERMVPDKADVKTFWEHIYRYRFATKFARGKVVLDIACGEGYGSAALKRAGAAKVIGVDLSEEACAHVRSKYDIETRVGDAEAIPLDDSSVDLVVSFETIEHVGKPARFLDEIKRVLRPNGIVVISTPNRDPYHRDTPNNPYHCSELALREFAELCNARFKCLSYFYQCSFLNKRWSLQGLDHFFSNDFNPAESGRKLKIAYHLQKRFCQNLSDEQAEYYSTHPIEAIFAQPTMLSSAFDPFAIRKLKSLEKETSIYTIAVGRKPTK